MSPGQSPQKPRIVFLWRVHSHRPLAFPSCNTYQFISVIALWRHCHGCCPVEMLTTPSGFFSTQKHSPHCSFEEEHYQIHSTDVTWPSYCYPLHSHADRERWKGWDNAGRPAQGPQKGLLPRSVSQSVLLYLSFWFCSSCAGRRAVFIVHSRWFCLYCSVFSAKADQIFSQFESNLLHKCSFEP